MSISVLVIGIVGGPDEPVDCPTWALVEAGIKALDGDKKDNLFLEKEDGSYMAVAGGRKNEYVVTGYLVNTGPFILAAGQGTGKTKHIPACGDEIPCADYEIATLDIVLDVTKTFFELGECDQKYKWNERSAITK